MRAGKSQILTGQILKNSALGAGVIWDFEIWDLGFTATKEPLL